MSNYIITVARSVQVKLPVGACRFISSVSRVDKEKEAKSFIRKISSHFHDATHNAYAYKIGFGDSAISRQSDDGEPAGTAGKPLLQAIESAGLTNLAIVATRYFGGVKLGIGGLIRAYRACAEAGLGEAGRQKEVFRESITVEADYKNIGRVLREINAAAGEIKDISYLKDRIMVAAGVPVHKLNLLENQLMDATRGKVKITSGDNN